MKQGIRTAQRAIGGIIVNIKSKKVTITIVETKTPNIFRLISCFFCLFIFSLAIF